MNAQTLQTLLDAGGPITLPPGDLLLTAPLYLTRPTTLVGTPGLSRLVAAAGSAWTSKGLLEVTGSDIQIRDLIVHGNRDANPLGRTFGVAVRGADRVTINNVQAFDMPASTPQGGVGGDGILVATNAAGKLPYQVSIIDCFMSGNVRQGISIAAGRRIWVRGCYITATMGSDPGGGIDLEPDQQTQAITDVIIADTIIDNCNFGLLAVNAVEAEMDRIMVANCAFRKSRTQNVRISGNIGITWSNVVSR